MLHYSSTVLFSMLDSGELLGQVNARGRDERVWTRLRVPDKADQRPYSLRYEVRAW